VDKDVTALVESWGCRGVVCDVLGLENHWAFFFLLRYCDVGGEEGEGGDGAVGDLVNFLHWSLVWAE